MKLTINTSKLQDLVTKSMKGASNDKLIPITGLMAIQLKDNKLTLITTDATNYLYVYADKVAGEDFYAVVQTDIFSKLVSKLTCETVTLEKTDNNLTILGNGKYAIELPLNEDGQEITYPDPLSKELIPIEGVDINLSTIKLILNTAKPALADNLDIPCYTGYYVGDNIVATDTYKICGINVKMWDTPALISPEMMDLLSVFTDEKIRTTRDESTMILQSEDCAVYGKLMDTLNEFQITVINGLLDDKFNSSCVVAKDNLLQLLDRLNLFVATYDKNCIYLTFTRNGLQIESKQANSVETIEYLTSDNFVDFTCAIDIEMLRSQIKANNSDRIEIQYGKDNAIKIVDGNVTQVIALLEDDK